MIQDLQGPYVVFTAPYMAVKGFLKFCSETKWIHLECKTCLYTASVYCNTYYEINVILFSMNIVDVGLNGCISKTATGNEKFCIFNNETLCCQSCQALQYVVLVQYLQNLQTNMKGNNSNDLWKNLGDTFHSNSDNMYSKLVIVAGCSHNLKLTLAQSLYSTDFSFFLFLVKW